MSDEDTSNDYYPRRGKWTRAVFILIILFSYGFAEALLWFLAIVQFFWVIFKSEPNHHIQLFAGKLIRWTSIAISFCLWKTDTPPFPFSPWPDQT